MQRIRTTSGRTRTALTREPPTRGHVGPDSAVMAWHPTPHGWCPPQDARPHAPCHLWRYAGLCGLGCCGSRCRRTAAWRLGLPRAGSQQGAAAEQIEARPPKYLPVHHFEAVDVPLDRAGAPGQGDAGFDRRIVLRQSGGEALQGFQRTGRRALEPGIKLRGLALADQGRKVLGAVDRLGDLGRLRVELGELLGLGRGALRRPAQHDPRRPARREGLAEVLRLDRRTVSDVDLQE